MAGLIERARRFARPYRIGDGKRFRLRDIGPDDVGDLTSGRTAAATPGMSRVT